MGENFPTSRVGFNFRSKLLLHSSRDEVIGEGVRFPEKYYCMKIEKELGALFQIFSLFVVSMSLVKTENNIRQFRTQPPLTFR